MAVDLRIKDTADGIDIVLCLDLSSIGIFVVPQMEGPCKAVIGGINALSSGHLQFSVDQSYESFLCLEDDLILLRIIRASGVHCIRIRRHDCVDNTARSCRRGITAFGRYGRCCR